MLSADGHTNALTASSSESYLQRDCSFACSKSGLAGLARAPGTGLRFVVGPAIRDLVDRHTFLACCTRVAALILPSMLAKSDLTGLILAGSDHCGGWANRDGLDGNGRQ